MSSHRCLSATESPNRIELKAATEKSNADSGLDTKPFLDSNPATIDGYVKECDDGSDNDDSASKLDSDSNWREDWYSIGLLLYLYMLQGIPIGLITAIPLILQTKGVTYSDQAIFSFATWPFSIKLLWAPIVDAVYCKRFGRRKSWMVPCQYLIGIFLLVISFFSSEILGTEGEEVSKPPNVGLLMAIFLTLNFLAATQDIAVDGWALTMLKRKNVGYASTCNVVGQTAGTFLGNVVFLTLQSKHFANKWIRSTPSDKGLVGLDGFVFFWGLVFLLSTTLILIFKRETTYSDDNDDTNLGVLETYMVLAKILCLTPIIWFATILLTGKIAFAATDGITDLKLINAGITTDKIASRLIFLTPLQIILPWILSKKTASSRPLNVYLWSYPYRILVGIAIAGFVYWTPSFREENGEYPYLYYIIWILIYHFQQAAHYCIFLSTMAFFAQISDPRVGGTYMTLLNTLNNLGGNWPVTLFLKLTDWFNKKNCIQQGTKTLLYACTAKDDESSCVANGNICEWVIDGYYISVGICSVFGLVWYFLFYRRIHRIQKLSRSSWKVNFKRIK
ncbi:acetyl-coenzyme A transporter 1 domain-containing protein [Ditylenchus destructor]|nr:acetyl-coenzyme A transporter 1 domain-containing protein [Ditylenchus destructor]